MVPMSADDIDTPDTDDENTEAEGTRDCPSCKENLPFDEGNGIDDDWRWSPLYEDHVCAGCAEDPYPSVMHRFNHLGHDMVEFGDVSANVWHDGDIVDYDTDFPEWMSAMMKDDHVWDGRPYKHTDGWRGYYDFDAACDFETKLVRIEDGWVTGWADEYTSRKLDALSFFDRLKELSEEGGEIPKGVTIYALFEPTSNVFSTACGIACPKDEEPAVRAWLRDTFGADVERELERNLG